MAFSKKLFLLILLCVALSQFNCIDYNQNQCEPDQYGSNVILRVPVEIELPRDTLIVGDTIRVSAFFDKNIEVEGSLTPTFLEGFNFFSDIIISEISDTVENFDLDVEVIPITGEIVRLPLTTAVAYPAIFVEDNEGYSFEAKFVINECGTFNMGWTSDLAFLFEDYEHPFMYQCDDRRRSSFDIYYDNPFTTIEEFDNIVLTTQVDYLLELATLEGHQQCGCRAFIVREP